MNDKYEEMRKEYSKLEEIHKQYSKLKWVTNPSNILNCGQCPYNNDLDDFLGRMTCEQSRCWVEIYCRLLGETSSPAEEFEYHFKRNSNMDTGSASIHASINSKKEEEPEEPEEYKVSKDVMNCIHSLMEIVDETLETSPDRGSYEWCKLIYPKLVNLAKTSVEYSSLGIGSNAKKDAYENGFEYGYWFGIHSLCKYWHRRLSSKKEEES